MVMVPDKSEDPNEKLNYLKEEAKLPARTRLGLCLTWHNPTFFIRIL